MPQRIVLLVVCFAAGWLHFGDSRAADDDGPKAALQGTAQAKTPEELGKLLYEALRDNDKDKLLSLLATFDQAKRFEGSRTGNKSMQELLAIRSSTLSKLPATYEDMLNRANKFATEQGFDWKTTQFDATTMTIAPRAGNNPRFFLGLRVRLTLRDRPDAEINIETLAGERFDGFWYLSERPNKLSLTTKEKDESIQFGPSPRAKGQPKATAPQSETPKTPDR
jgi:hypothetical protein